MDARKVDKPALRLGDDLLRDHEHIARRKRGVRRDQLTDIVSRPHLRQPFDPNQLDALHTARRIRSRSAGSSMSSAIASERKSTNFTPRFCASARNWASDSSPK